MLGAGGTCEFSAQTLRSDRRGAHVSPASARASDPAAPPSGITHTSDDATSPMRTGKTHRLKTCATRRGSDGHGQPRAGLSNTGWKPVLLQTGRHRLEACATGVRQAQVTNLCYRERTRFRDGQPQATRASARNASTSASVVAQEHMNRQPPAPMKL